jgi:hypothetical protein
VEYLNSRQQKVPASKLCPMVNPKYILSCFFATLADEKAIAGGPLPTPRSLAAVAAMQQEPDEAGPSNGLTFAPIDSSLTRDSSSKAFMRELRKVIERSDVIIQVLDSRDPEGTRSRWVEEEVRKRDLDGKKLLAVMNKIGKFALRVFGSGD